VLIEVTSQAQANKALKMTTWINVHVQVSPHRSLDMSKGIICCRDLRDCNDEEILDGLRPKGVTNGKHILSNKSGIKLPTNTFVLTLSKPSAPKYVKAAYLKIPVEMFIPNPLRCLNCQKFGHGRNTCNRPAICAKCGQQGHLDVDCKTEPQCANCSGLHPAFSKECQEWIEKREIMKIKTEHCTSFSEATQLYDQQFQSSSAAVLPRLGGLAVAMQLLLNPHVAYLRRPNSHGQLIAQHLLKHQKHNCQRKCGVADVQ
jgi:hypothetical protein